MTEEPEYELTPEQEAAMDANDRAYDEYVGREMDKCFERQERVRLWKVDNARLGRIPDELEIWGVLYPPN